MAQFKDNAGRDWTIWIDVNAARRLRRSLDVDLMDAVGGDLLARMGTDPVLLVDVIYLICKPQADERGVSDEEFGRSLVGEAIEAATDAFLEALLAFFPPRRRALLEATLARAKAIQETMLAAAEKALETHRIDGDLERMMSGDSSTRPPASVDSNPDR